MLRIGELSQKVDLPTQTIRYYERMRLLPKPRRALNGYRHYDHADVQRLRFIRSARALNFSLDDIHEILELRDRGTAPCRVAMDLMSNQISAIDRRIRELGHLRAELRRLHGLGRRMPEDVRMKACVCHLIETSADESAGSRTTSKRSRHARSLGARENRRPR